ncbi:MAG: hypothetical protein [Circular genetic element sp.]|nr:MAG: hypothetical protein [Circular genetic element sp.]
MIAIPAYQAYMLQGTPSFQIFIRGGETLVPTGGNVSDVQEAINEPASLEKLRHSAVKRTRKPSAYSKKYSKAFDKVKGQYKLKSGKWKKDGFKRAVRAAHKVAKGGKK